MRFRPKTPARLAGFDITPMIDVTMLLIIFFMLSAQFAQAGRTPLPLPREAGRDSARRAAHVMVIDVLGPNRVALDGAAIAVDELVAAVAAEQKRVAQRGQSIDVIVRAAKDMPSAPVNSLAQKFARAGVRSWKFATAGEEDRR